MRHQISFNSEKAIRLDVATNAVISQAIHDALFKYLPSEIYHEDMPSVLTLTIIYDIVLHIIISNLNLIATDMADVNEVNCAIDMMTSIIESKDNRIMEFEELVSALDSRVKETIKNMSRYESDIVAIGYDPHENFESDVTSEIRELKAPYAELEAPNEDDLYEQLREEDQNSNAGQTKRPTNPLSIHITREANGDGGDDILLASEAGEALGLTRSQVYRLLYADAIKGYKCGKIWKIPRKEVTKFMYNRSVILD